MLLAAGAPELVFNVVVRVYFVFEKLSWLYSVKGLPAYLNENECWES